MHLHINNHVACFPWHKFSANVSWNFVFMGLERERSSLTPSPTRCLLPSSGACWLSLEPWHCTRPPRVTVPTRAWLSSGHKPASDGPSFLKPPLAVWGYSHNVNASSCLACLRWWVDGEPSLPWFPGVSSVAHG